MKLSDVLNDERLKPNAKDAFWVFLAQGDVQIVNGEVIGSFTNVYKMVRFLNACAKDWEKQKAAASKNNSKLLKSIPFFVNMPITLPNGYTIFAQTTGYATGFVDLDIVFNDWEVNEVVSSLDVEFDYDCFTIMQDENTSLHKFNTLADYVAANQG